MSLFPISEGNPMAQKIRKQKKDTYRITVSMGYDDDGKQVNVGRVIRATSQRAAQRAWEQLYQEVHGDVPATDGQLTLHQFFDYYITHYASKHVTENTIQYDKYLFRRIDKHLGQYALERLRPFNVMDFLEQLSKGDGKKKLSPNTIQKHYALLHAILEKAVQWQFIKDNPATHIDKPKRAKPSMEILDTAECKAILEALSKEDIKHQALVNLTIYTGMRRGEIFGLQWKHIDFKAKTVTIEQECQWNTGVGNHIVDRTKGGSARTISIPDVVCGLLSAYQREIKKVRNVLRTRNEWKGAEDIQDDFIFCTFDGRLGHADQFNAWLDRFTKKNGFKRVTPHTFRHMVASYLLAAGVDLQTVAGKLGHANTLTTQAIYSHLLKSSEHKTADILQDMLKR